MELKSLALMEKLGIEVAIFTGEGLSQAQRDRIESIRLSNAAE